MDYYNLDCVSASTMIENNLNGLYKVLEKVGNKEQRNISDTDAIKLIQEMEKQADILDECLDLIEQQINGNGMGNTPVDDEMFAMLQEQYSDVVDLHNTIIDAYNAGLLKNSKEASEALDSIADLINAIGEVEREGLTVEDALEYQQDMIDAVNYLNEMLHYM